MSNTNRVTDTAVVNRYGQHAKINKYRKVLTAYLNAIMVKRLNINCMSNTKPLHQHLVEKFLHYTTNELVILNNDLVKSNWGTNKTAFRTALLSTLSNRGIDLSAILSTEDGFTQIQRVAVKLNGNKLIPIN